VPHATDDDVLCILSEGSQASGQALLTPGGAEHQPDHCVICHANRSLRTTLADSGPATVTLTSGHKLITPADRSHRNCGFDKLPARAPPHA